MVKMIKNRYIGKFAVQLELINDRPSEVLEFMQGMIVLTAKIDPAMDSVVYVAISPKHFDPVPLGQRAPFYTFEIDKRGSILANFTKQRG